MKLGEKILTIFVKIRHFIFVALTAIFFVSATILSAIGTDEMIIGCSIIFILVLLGIVAFIFYRLKKGLHDSA